MKIKNEEKLFKLLEHWKKSVSETPVGEQYDLTGDSWWLKSVNELRKTVAELENENDEDKIRSILKKLFKYRGKDKLIWASNRVLIPSFIGGCEKSQLLKLKEIVIDVKSSVEFKIDWIENFYSMLEKWNAENVRKLGLKSILFNIFGELFGKLHIEEYPIMNTCSRSFLENFFEFTKYDYSEFSKAFEKLKEIYKEKIGKLSEQNLPINVEIDMMFNYFDKDVEGKRVFNEIIKGPLHGESPENTFWVEIGAPPSKDYIGKYVWAPKAPIWKELEKVKKGDVVYHYREKFVGKSKVKGGPNIIRKDELIEKMKEIDVNWEFKGDWSKYENFYIVELQDYEEFEHPISKDEVGFDPPQKYFVRADSDIVRRIEESVNKIEISPSLHVYLRSRGYLFPAHLVAQFYVAIKTKGFVILSGLSGTGKTKMAVEFARLFEDHSKLPSNIVFLSVRPDWRDSKPIIGWYNPLSGSYSRTQLLDFILKAKEDYDKNRGTSKPYFVILDEMNLAHVEYYFADFLSVLESGRDESGFTRESIKLHDVDELNVPREIKLPPNLYIIGTVNVDETTYTFSPKVLDRAFTIEFHNVDLDEYPPGNPDVGASNFSVSEELLKDFVNNGKFLSYTKEEINRVVEEFKSGNKYWNALINLNKALEPYDLHFGYRVVDEIALFFKNARDSKNKGIVEFQNDDEIFDLAILMKILPKFHGNRKKLEKPLLLLLELAKKGTLNEDDIHKKADELFEDIFGAENTQNRIDSVVRELTNPSNTVFRHTAKKILRMLRQLYEVGFASFS